MKEHAGFKPLTILLAAFIVALALWLCSCSAGQPVRDDDSNTVNTLDSLNPTSGNYGSTNYAGQLFNFLSKEDANRWSEQGTPFQNWVSITANANSCLGVSGAGLTMTPVSCIAYNAGFRGTETGSITFSNNATTWVAMDENTAGNNAGLPNFTRVPSTHYLIDSLDALQPAMVSDTQLLMKVVTAGGAITTVTDLRTTKAVNAVGTVTSITATSPVVVTPSPIVSAGAISVTTIPATLGGTGIASPTAHDVMFAEGGSAFNVLNFGLDTFLLGAGASADPTAEPLVNCANDGLHAEVWSTATHHWACATLISSVAPHGSQEFTSSGTFTVPTNVFSINILCIGPGGGGGGYGVGFTNGGNGSTTTVVSGGTTYCDAPAANGALGVAAGSLTQGAAGGGNPVNGLLKVNGGAGFAGVVNDGIHGGYGGISTCGAPNRLPAAAGGIGAGGQGGGAGSLTVGAGGGGAGACSRNIVTTTPTTTFTVTVSAGGIAGTGGTDNGQAGGSGEVLITW